MSDKTLRERLKWIEEAIGFAPYYLRDSARLAFYEVRDAALAQAAEAVCEIKWASQLQQRVLEWKVGANQWITDNPVGTKLYTTPQPTAVVDAEREAWRDLVQRAWQVLDVECPNDAITDELLAALAPDPASDDGVTAGRADDTKVICPNCVHQFRALPLQIQGLLLDAGYSPPFTKPASDAQTLDRHSPFYQEPLPDRNTAKTDREQGLFRKFDVRRTDGTDAPGGKHHGCDYFVLDVSHDKLAPVALEAYANAAKAEYPDLARDMIDRYDLPASDAGEGS